MRLEYIQTFVDSAQNVLEGLIHSVIKTGSITLKDSLSASGLSATVFVAGGVEGRIVLDIEPGLAKKVAGLMNGIDFDHLDHLAVDTICELTNIIIGKAVTLLNNKGFRFKTSPPCFFIGEKTWHGLESMCICLSTELGDIKVMAAIKEKAAAFV